MRNAEETGASYCLVYCSAKIKAKWIVYIPGVLPSKCCLLNTRGFSIVVFLFCCFSKNYLGILKLELQIINKTTVNWLFQKLKVISNCCQFPVESIMAMLLQQQHYSTFGLSSFIA